MKQTPQELIGLSEHQFQLQSRVKSLWQSIAEIFYPERADFTNARNVGREFADHLSDSFPLLIRRDLGDSLSAMLRDGDWFSMGVEDGEPDYSGRRWLQEKTIDLRRHMYHRASGFVRSSKEGDHDFVTFGQCVKSVSVHRRYGCLSFRTYHLRDCAWWEDDAGEVCGVVRKSPMTRRDLITYFGEDKLHANITNPEQVRKDPFGEQDILHLVIPSDMYGDDELEARFPYVSIYLDKKNTHIIEEVGLNHKYYVVPRFQTIAGSPYAYSPATTVGLSDARVLQAMTHTLIEAAERYARPPLVGTAGITRSDVDLRADGITWVDEEYDQRGGAALSELYQGNRGGWPIGDAERTRIVETLTSAFYLNKLTLPDPSTGDMTAYEVQERMKQYRRQNLPLFAPIEAEDNGQVCELAFEIALANNMLGSPQDIPPSLRGREVQFKFETPLTATEEEQRVQHFAQVREMLAGAIEFDPSIGHDIDLSTALRDAVSGSGAPVRWLTDPEVAAQNKQQAQMMSAAQDLIAQQ